jgi:hypothetical protein
MPAHTTALQWMKSQKTRCPYCAFGCHLKVNGVSFDVHVMIRNLFQCHSVTQNNGLRRHLRCQAEGKNPHLNYSLQIYIFFFQEMSMD